MKDHVGLKIAAGLALLVILLLPGCKQPLDSPSSFFLKPVIEDNTPAAPLLPTVTAWDGMITVSWLAVDGADSYEVYYGDTQTAPGTPASAPVSTNTVITGLTNTTTYYVWVKAVNAYGAGALSPMAHGIPWPGSAVPQTPGTFTVTPGINQLTLSWDAAGGAESYDVYINTTPSSGSAGLSATVTGTTVAIGSLTNGTIYYLWIKARNTNGASGFSPIGSGTPNAPTAPPAAPGAPLVTPGSTELTVSWAAVEMALSYEVWAGTSDDSGLASKRGGDISGGGLSVAITGLNNGTTYYVWVKAKNALGASGFSPSAIGTPSVFAAAPAEPGMPVITLGSTQLSVQWAAVEGATAYEAWTGGTDNSAGAAKYGGDIDGTSLTITGLSNGTTYYVWVKAKNGVGASGFSPAANGTPSASTVVPIAPDAPTVAAGSHQLSVSWAAVEGASAYQVWTAASNSAASAAQYGSDITGGLSAVIGSLNNGTTYYVWVKAKNGIGVSGFSPAASGAPSAASVIPPVPSAPSLIIGSTQLTVNWAAVEGAEAYQVYTAASNNTGSAAQYGGDITGGLSATIGSLSNGATYYVWIKARNSIGASGFSPVASGKPIANAGTPTASPGNGQIAVVWASVAGADEYEVYCGTGDNPPAAAAQTVSAPATSATISSLANGTTYRVWIRGRNATGTGGISAAASAKPIANMGAVSVTPASGQLALSWAAVEGADQYEVYYATSSTIPGTAFQTVSATTATITGLANGTTYYVWVKGKNASGSGGISAMASGKPLATPGTPTVSAGNGQLTVSWTAAAGADQYEVYYGIGAPATLADTVSGTSTAITGLANGTAYSVAVRGKNATGIGGTSAAASGTPVAVAGQPTIILGNRQLVVQWDAAAGASAYEVWTGTTNNTGSATKYGGDITGGLSATIGSLSNGTTYYVWVKAKNGIGTSGFSPVSSGTPSASAATPANPLAPTATAGSHQLSVSWAAVEGASAYEVWAGASSNSALASKRGGDITGGLSAVISGLDNGTLYYVWVKAKNGIGTSGFSPSASATPSAATVIPQAPSAPSLAIGNAQVTVSWAAVEGASAYEVWTNTANNSASATKYGGDITGGLSVVIGSLSNGTTYYVWVKAKNGIGASGFSAGASGKPIANAGTPNVSPGNGQIAVSWASVAGAEEYEVYYGTGDNPPATAAQTVTTLSTTITGLANGTTYNVWIKGKNTIGAGGISGSASAKPIANMGTVTVTPSSGQLALSWAAVAGADQYEVYYSTSTTIPATASFTVTDTAKTITGLTNGTTYYVWVRGKNASGNGGISTMANAKPAAVMGTLTLTSAPGQLTVAWAAVAGIDQYEVYYSTGTTVPASPSQTVSAPTISAAIPGLTNGTSYNVWVRGINATGSNSISPMASGKPIANMGTVSVSPSSGQLALSWAAVAGADQYEVYYAASNSMPGTASQTVSATTATITGLTNGTTYYAWVKGKNANGTSAASTAVTGKPLATPTAPTIVAGNGQLTISWTAAAGADQYEVYYGIWTPATLADTVTGTSKTITGLANGTTYSVAIRGKNATGIGGISATASAKPIANMGTVSVTSGTAQIALSWAAVAGADEYEVYYSTSSTIPATASFTVTDTAKTITGLTNGATYYVWVKGKNTSGNSGISIMVSATPAAVMGALTITPASSQLTVAWAAVAGADQYEIYYSTGTTVPASPTQTISAPTTSATITSLTNGTNYNVWVRGINTGGSNSISPMASGKPIANMGTVSVVSGTAQIALSWAAVAGADQYEIYYNTSNSIPGTASQTVSTTTATITGLTNGTTYYAWVKGKNANGTNAASAAVTGKPLATPAVPTLAAGNGQLTISWTAAAGADQYEVYYGIWTPATLADTVTGTSKTITGLTNGTTYSVAVRGKNATGIGGISATASAKPIANMGTVSVTSGTAQITFSWTAVAGADQYEVYYSTSNTIPATASYTVTATAKTITGLTNGTAYYAWVKGKNANGTNAASTIVSGKPLATPAAPSIEAGASSLGVSWSASAGADEYEVYYGIGTPTTLADTVTGTSKIITGLTNGTTYSVRIRGKNTTGTSIYSSTASGTPILQSGLYDDAIDLSHYVGSLNITASLSHLASAAATGHTYYIILGTDETLTGKSIDAAALNNKTGVTIVLKGNGAERNIQNAGYSSLFTVSAGTLVLDEYITLQGHIDGSSPVVKVSGASLEMRNGAKITANKAGSGGGVNISGSNSTFIMNGGTISGNLATGGGYGGGVFVGGTNSNFTMNGGSISGNDGSNGGGVYISGGNTFTMSGGTISGNTGTYGGGVTFASSSFTMNGGTISNNTATMGGGVYFGGASFIMNEGTISDNTATGYLNAGGGVLVSGGSFTMNGGTISRNTAPSHGGGVKIGSSSSFTMNGGIISGNTATAYVGGSYYGGGGVYVMSGGTFTKTTAGGIVYGNNASPASLKNSADGLGDAVYVSASKKRNTTVGANEALSSGSTAGWE